MAVWLSGAFLRSQDAFSLPSPCGHGVVIAIFEPVTNLQDAYGSMDIDQIEKMTNSGCLRQDVRYAKG